MKKLLPVTLCVLYSFIHSSLFAQQFNVAGSAMATSCSCYEITRDTQWQGGAIWNKTAINLVHPFDFKYKIYLGSANPNSPNACGIGADGMCFVLQNTNTGVSTNGGGLGYQDFPNQSLGIEFDTYQNTWDPAFSHIAIEAGGQVVHPIGTLSGPVQMSATETYTADGNFHNIEIKWDTATQTISAYFDGTFRLSYTFPNGILTDIFTGSNSPVYWGFTGSTGNLCNVQQICTTFEADFSALPSCNSDSVIFTNKSIAGTDSIQSYAWNFGDGQTSNVKSPVHVYASAGTKTVTLVATDLGGCSDTVTKTVSVNSSGIDSPVYRKTPCYNLPTNSKDTIFANPNGTPGLTFHWNNNATTSSITVAPNQFFSVTVTNVNNGCSSVFSDTIGQANPQIHNTNVLTLHLCTFPAYGDLQLTGVGGTGTLTYLVTGIGKDSSGLFPNLSPGTYNFTITDSLGCTQTSSVNIPNSLASDSFNVVTDSITCYGFNNGQIIILPQNPDDGPFQYSVDGSGLQFSDTFTNVGPGEHTILVKSFIFGCTYNLSAQIDQPTAHTVNATPDSINGNPGDMDTISVTTDFVNPVYTWSPVKNLTCTQCDTTILTLDSTTNNTYYTVTVHSEGDSTCYASDSVHIVSKLPIMFVMPSAFAPNGQGPAIDQTFGPVPSSAFSTPTIKGFRIYNRWGQMVHNSTSFWDGKFEGKDQPVGTYVYYIEVQYNDQTSPNGFRNFKKEGSVTLLR